MVHLLTTRVAAADSLLSLALHLFLLPFLRIFLPHNVIFVADINNHIAIAFIKELGAVLLGLVNTSFKSICSRLRLLKSVSERHGRALLSHRLLI